MNMLNAEELKKKLETYRSDKFIDQRLARLAGLPKALHPEARALLRLEKLPEDEESERYWIKEQKRSQKAAAAFKAMSPEDRSRAIESVYPEIATAILKAMENVGRRPYSAGYGRKPFRAPRRQLLLEQSRLNFLSSLVSELEQYPADLQWIAAWAPHVWPWRGAFVAPLLAAAIDQGDDAGNAVFEILLASAKGEHEIGQMGKHIIQTLLLADRPEGWEFVEKLLRAAQREEGLRQTILESVDEGNPEAFKRMLKVVLENDLTRFSATVRAVDVWFGFAWDAMSAGKARKIIEQTIGFLEDPAGADRAIAAAAALPTRTPAKGKSKPASKKLEEAHESVEPAYIALWSKAFVDVDSAIESAKSLLASADVDARFAATHLLAQLNLNDTVAPHIAAMLDDADDRVAARALSYFYQNRYDRSGMDDDDEEGADRHVKHPVADLFERLEKLIARAPAKSTKLAPIIWPWMGFQWSKAAVGSALVSALGKRPPTRLLAYIEEFDPSTRRQAVDLLGKSKTWDDATRKTLFAMVGDPSANVREEALKHLKKCRISPAETEGLEELLTRKASDLRRAILTLLLSQADDGVLASADRLMAAKSELLRLGGLELLREMAGAGRSEEAVSQRARQYQQAHAECSADEQAQLDALLKPKAQTLTFDNCLGLIDPSRRTQPAEPQRRSVEYVTAAARELLASLDELVHKHRDESFTPRNHRGEEREAVLLGNATWNFPTVDEDKPIEEQLDRLPLKEVWTSWYEKRPASMRDKDGLELIQAALLLSSERGYSSGKKADWVKSLQEMVWPGPNPKIRYRAVVSAVLGWLGVIHPVSGTAFRLDGLENLLAAIPREKLTATQKRAYSDEKEVIWRTYDSPIRNLCSCVCGELGELTAEENGRLYRLLRWMDEPGVAIERDRADLDVLLRAFREGQASAEDVYDAFLGPHGETYYSRSSELARFCGLETAEEIKKNPALKPIVERCRDRVLEIELARGETPTLVSEIAGSLSHTGGLDVLSAFLRVAEKNTFARGHAWGDKAVSKAVVFSKIIRATYPTESDTPEKFAAAMSRISASDDRLIELAVYAPQWVDHVAHAIKWPHLPEAVWWIRAHTRDRGWSVDQELRERWKAQVARRTPLDEEDLLDGAVDVAWFNRTYEAMGNARWQSVYDAAKFAASGGGHKRAQLFADAMLGKVNAKELIERINSKRHQDAVRALGLLPLPEGEKAKAQILSRYKTLSEFIRTSRQFGSQRQTSEKRAANIAMENLARTAGYPDPIRLQWAMEALSCADLAKGPVRVSAGDVTVTLAIDSDGAPEITCEKKGKTLAAIPPAAKKLPKIQELSERKTELKRSSSRMRSSLEQAMVRGDSFSASELRELMTNPLLAPMLSRLVFVGEGILGYPVDGGRGLANHGGKIEPIKASEALRLAHPHDLLKSKQWTQWQHDCFRRELVQPFKQVFRELYVTTQTELEAKDVSRRYAGHQIQPKQAMALLGSRGWVIAPEEGVSRTFHELGWTAWLTFQEPFYTPADIEGLTLEGVRFTQKADRCDWASIKDVPPRMFSEVMRDMDLVVSVAHRGEIDPEASASTIQVRSALLNETLELLALKNVTIKNNHAMIRGELAEYTVHLGSAVTHRQPGGALFIVPVHSQHRGRLFLPFVDDDPKTAEVLSKVILLARDREIKDPNLLSQIRGLAV